MNIKQAYQTAIQYVGLVGEVIRDIYEQDIRGLDDSQVYTIRKLGDRFPRPLKGLEAKL